MATEVKIEVDDKVEETEEEINNDQEFEDDEEGMKLSINVPEYMINPLNFLYNLIIYIFPTECTR